VRDAANTTQWSSAASASSTSRVQGWLYQITSQGKPGVNCIFSGPTPAAVSMRSPGQGYSLQISQDQAALSLRGSDGVKVSSSRSIGCAAANLCTRHVCMLWQHPAGRLSPTSSCRVCRLLLLQVWAPSGALPGSAPAQLCITAAGKLQLNSASPAGSLGKSLWSSSYAVPAPARAPFTALVSDDGRLEVVDGTCKLLYSTTLTPGKKAAPAPMGHTGMPEKQARLPKTRPPPPATTRRKAVAAFHPPTGSSPTCMLGAGELCGGISFCGADRDCPAKGCCTAPLGCRRSSREVWRCQ
jgi:hypothetical protein